MIAYIFAALLFISISADAQTRATKMVATFDGVGPVKIGMTTAQATKALGVRVKRDEAMYKDNKECYYATASGRAYKDLAFMMSGERIVRIDINSKALATDKGAKNGDTEARIKQLYRGMYKISPHKYVDGHYIEIANRSKKNTILFETDGKHVTTFRVGLTEPVGYVEGCS